MKLTAPAIALLACWAGFAPAFADHASSTKLLDQARALIEARGVPGRERDGFALMKKIADEGEGQAAVLAQWNVANFYLNGIGTEPSLDAALVYLNRAKAAGLPEAAALLTRLDR
jgi:TPR repeat protein